MTTSWSSLDVPQNLLLSEIVVSEVTVQLLNPTLYWYHDIYLKLDQEVNKVNLQPNVEEEHLKAFAKVRHVQGCHYILGLMTVLLSAELNRKASLVSRLVDENEGQKAVSLDLSLFSWMLAISLTPCRWCRSKTVITSQRATSSWTSTFLKTKWRSYKLRLLVSAR